MGTAISVGDGASAEALSKAGTGNEKTSSRRVVSSMLKLKRKRISHSHCFLDTRLKSAFFLKIPFFFQLFVTVVEIRT